MLRQLLEGKIGYLDDSEFSVILKITEDDIKFNRLGFKKHTNLNYVLDIAIRSALVLRKCA